MKATQLDRGLLYFMAAGAGLVVANNYYNQPLLNLIANTFSVTEAQVSNIPLATQLGYAFGLLFIIPLGDKFSRRTIIFLSSFTSSELETFNLPIVSLREFSIFIFWEYS